MSHKTKDDQCWYCGCDLVEWDSPTAKSSDIRSCKVREHQTPKSRGGTITVAACFTCNCKKGTKDVEEYRNYLRSKIATMKAANSLREALPSLTEDFRLELQKVADVLEGLTPRIVFFGEKKA